MKTMKQIVVAVSLLVISAMAPVVEAQQGVEKADPGTLVAPADALNSLVKMTESQMISLGRMQIDHKSAVSPIRLDSFFQSPFDCVFHFILPLPPSGRLMFSDYRCDGRIRAGVNSRACPGWAEECARNASDRMSRIDTRPPSADPPVHRFDIDNPLTLH